MKRFYLSLLAIAMIAALTTAGSLALFTATTTNVGNTFTAGTVTLGQPAHNLVDVANIAPGDFGTFDYAVTYTGSLDAWIGIDTTATGNLLTCDGGKFQLTINGGAFNINAPNQVVAMVPTGAVTHFDIDWALPLNTGNDCQGKSASLSMLVKAVQAKNNTLPAPGVGPISWN